MCDLGYRENGGSSDDVGRRFRASFEQAPQTSPRQGECGLPIMIYEAVPHIATDASGAGAREGQHCLVVIAPA